MQLVLLLKLSMIISGCVFFCDVYSDFYIIFWIVKVFFLCVVIFTRLITVSLSFPFLPEHFPAVDVAFFNSIVKRDFKREPLLLSPVVVFSSSNLLKFSQLHCPLSSLICASFKHI